MTTRAGYQDVPDDAAAPASRSWWDANAREYLAEHGEFLGDEDFCWCPEGLREADAGILGDVRGRQVLEIGAGAAQCSAWLAARGAHTVATDLSGGMLRAGARADGCPTLVQADARRLPFARASFDVVFTSYGALPFVPDAAAVHREVARVLRPGGRWAFSVTHPVRWAFPDDPGAGGLTVSRSYFDRTPYAERDEDGQVSYVEYHRTLGDHVRELRAAGLVLEDLIEPEWPEGHERTWGGWSALRGTRIPGTAIFVASRPA